MHNQIYRISGPPLSRESVIRKKWSQTLTVQRSGFDEIGIVKRDNDSFLNSSSQEPILIYQITSDSPQKDNFHNPLLQH